MSSFCSAKQALRVKSAAWVVSRFSWPFQKTFRHCIKKPNRWKNRGGETKKSGQAAHTFYRSGAEIISILLVKCSSFKPAIWLRSLENSALSRKKLKPGYYSLTASEFLRPPIGIAHKREGDSPGLDVRKTDPRMENPKGRHASIYTIFYILAKWLVYNCWI